MNSSCIHKFIDLGMIVLFVHVNSLNISNSTYLQDKKTTHNTVHALKAYGFTGT